MSSITRKLERNIIKNNIQKDRRSVKKCFAKEWSNFRENKYVVKDEDGNIVSDNTPKNTMRKKQSHFDSMEQYNRLFAFIDNLKQETMDEDSKEVTEVTA